MKIYAPVKDVNGMYASVQFVNGVGETDNPHLIEWFKSHGYEIENDRQPSLETLVEIARVLQVDVKDLLQSTIEDQPMVYIKLPNNNSLQG